MISWLGGEGGVQLLTGQSTNLVLNHYTLHTCLPSLVETGTSPFGQNLSCICSPLGFSVNWSRYHCGNAAWWTSSCGFAAWTWHLYSSKWNLWMWWQQVVLEPCIKHFLSLCGGTLFSSRVLLVISLRKKVSPCSHFEFITYLHKVHHPPFHVPFSCENCTLHLFIKINSRSHVLFFVGMFTGIAATWWSLRSCIIVSIFISFKNLIYWCFKCLLRHIIIDHYNFKLRINIINFFNAGWLWSVFAMYFPFFLLVSFHDEGWSSSDESTADFFLVYDMGICLTCTWSSLLFWGLSI